MAKSYSPELRQKVIDEYFSGEISMRNLAKKFEVSKTWVYKLIKEERARRKKIEMSVGRNFYVVGGSSDPNINNSRCFKKSKKEI